MIFILYHVLEVVSLPLLDVSGFSWYYCIIILYFSIIIIMYFIFYRAENLHFDGNGNLFVSEIFGKSGGGELWKISLNETSQQYERTLHLSGFNNIGGLTISKDGDIIYACVTFHDKSSGIISAKTSNNNNGEYNIIGKTSKKGNGLYLYNDVFYSAEEGGAKGDGTVFTVDLNTGKETIIQTNINGDGIWVDENTNRLFVGVMQKMNIEVFDISSSSSIKLIGLFPGPSVAYKITDLQLLDDLTIATKGGETNNDINNNSTELLGCDWVGKKLLRFTLDGTKVDVISPPEGIKFHELTSVRWGKGKGFDENSVYVTEGGGFTSHQTDRRVLQVPIIN